MNRKWMRSLRHAIAPSLAAIAGLIACKPAVAQDASLLRRNPMGVIRRPLTLENSSLLYQRAEPPKSLQLHDIVTVVVNVNARMFSEGDVQNRKQANLDMILKDWIGFDGLAFRPDPQTEGEPRVRGQLNSQFRSEAELKTRNTLTFTVAATVIDVLPNGTMVIEATQTLQDNEDVWEKSLTGVIRREDVSPDNKVESEDIAGLRILKREVGHVRDGYRRGWFQRLYDRFQPF